MENQTHFWENVAVLAWVKICVFRKDWYVSKAVLNSSLLPSKLQSHSIEFFFMDLSV